MLSSPGRASDYMTMASPDRMQGTEKRRRRRWRQDKPAITARLVLDDHVKSDTGILSEDLFSDLFPHLQDQYQNGPDDPSATQTTGAPDIHHVAIAPWAPHSSPDGTSWTVVPVTRSSALAHSTVQFSPSSLALQSFAATLQQIAPSKLSSHSRSGIEILVLDVTPFPLGTVFVSLEGDLAKRLEDGEGTFFREHPAVSSSIVRARAGSAASAEDRLTSALRTALGTLKVVHSGDLFPLPLPPHPITHVPPNPAKVTLCEPVAQGILSPSTRIIVSRGRVHSKHGRDAAPMPVARAINGVGGEEDTENDQFFSAAEERYKTDVQTEDTESVTEEETEVSGPEEDNELSDDSMDDMISLQTPTLPATAASGVSTVQPGTPMTVGRGRKTNGISTPVSVFSSFTATTARPDRPRGRLFKVQALMQQIPTQLLHPRPAAEDDEEARVYVDVRDLPRIGCFSGDWVRLEASEEPPAGGLGRFGLGSFGSPEAEEPNWRPVRVFGLPEGYSQRPMTRIPSSKHEHDGRRFSFFESQVQRTASPTAHLSPLLLANLDSAPYLRISPLKRASHSAKGAFAKLSASQPPFAREVVIQQVRTPVPIERDAQTAVMAALKWHFETKLRIIRSGDLIAVPIDTQLGRALHGSSVVDGDSAIDEMLSLTASGRAGQQNVRYNDVAWFKVSYVQAVRSESPEAAIDDEDTWGPAVCVEISLAHLEQTGSVTSRVPGTLQSSWPYYLGIKKLPSRPLDVISPTLQEPDRPYVSPTRRTLRELFAAATSKRAVHLRMPPVAVLLTSTQRNVGKATVVRSACEDLGLHAFAIDAYDILSQAGAGGSDVKTEGFLKARAERAMTCGPECCVLLVRHAEALTAERMVTAMKEVLAEARVLVATTTEVDKVPDGVRGLFTHEFEMSAPDEGEREGILKSIITESGLCLDPEVSLSSVALKTAALVAGDLVDVVDRARVAQSARLELLSSRATSDACPVTVRDIQVAGGPAARGLTREDFDIAVDAARKNFADAIGAPKIPNVTWDDVGGLDAVKDAITETIQLPLERPELFARGMKKRSGILLYGPPGTGKTLLAKAIATEYSLNFFSVKGPELLNMYIGESEANVRRVFARARDARPCVVFFDELDSVAPKRGNQGDSGGVMDRIVSQLLAELDGMSAGGEEGAGGVFVIGATNRPDLLDPALLRPGRFDKMLYLGVSDTHDKQLKIMEALTRKFTLGPTVSLRSVASRLPFTYTGADLYALCSDAMLKAVTRQAAAVDAKIRALNSTSSQKMSTAHFFDHYAAAEDVAVVVAERDFVAAQRELVPSVSAGELAHYERVRAAFEGGRERDHQPQLVRPDTARSGTGSMSSGSRGGGSKGKGKGKGVAGRKGKAVGADSDDEHGEWWGEDEEDRKGKGKGKGTATTAAVFGDGAGSDDERLYE